MVNESIFHKLFNIYAPHDCYEFQDATFFLLSFNITVFIFFAYTTSIDTLKNNSHGRLQWLNRVEKFAFDI